MNDPKQPKYFKDHRELFMALVHGKEIVYRHRPDYKFMLLNNELREVKINGAWSKPADISFSFPPSWYLYEG